MTTTLIVASSVLSSSSRSNESRRESDAIALASFQGVADQIKADSGNGVLTLPIVNNYTSGGYTWNVAASDNSASVPRSVLVTATATIGEKSYSESTVVVQRFGSSPLNYCLASNAAFTSAFTITAGSGGSNGDVYCNGIPTFGALAGSTVNGTLDTTAASVAGFVTVTGKETLNDTALTFPSLSAATYQANATTAYAGGEIFNNVTFPAPTGSTYPIFYVNGAATLKGTVTGEGVIFVNGALSVPANLTYANGSSRIAVIVNGGITVAGACTSMVGYWYSTGNITLVLALSRSMTGALVGNSFSMSGPLNITYDPDVFTYPSEGKKFCLPGFWP